MIYLKQLKKKIRRLIYFSKNVGMVNALKLFTFEFKKKGVLSLKLNGYNHAISLRANTSDVSTFEQIFIRKDYDIIVNFEPKFIIDGGAYIGLSSVYFSNRFPNATIIAVEPAISNFEMLKKNTSYYGNILPLNAALWSQKKSLALKDEGLGEWGFLVKDLNEKSEFSIEGVTVDQLLVNSAFSTIDLLKLDIEGSEVELFSKNYEHWLGKVKILLIELHESLRPGCSDIFFTTTKKYDFLYSSSGENEVLINKNLHK